MGETVCAVETAHYGVPVEGGSAVDIALWDALGRRFGALPDGMDLMVDANCSYTVSEAQRFLRHLPDTPLAWLEVKQVLAHGGADVLQPDVCRVGTARSSRRPSPDTGSGSTGSTATESNSPRLGRR